jgi:hypothetical protein
MAPLRANLSPLARLPDALPPPTQDCVRIPRRYCYTRQCWRPVVSQAVRGYQRTRSCALGVSTSVSITSFSAILRLPTTGPWAVFLLLIFAKARSSVTTVRSFLRHRCEAGVHRRRRHVSRTLSFKFHLRPNFALFSVRSMHKFNGSCLFINCGLFQTLSKGATE